LNHFIIEEANYLLDNGLTIRDAANYFSISKSTLHRHMNYDLKKIDLELYRRIKNLFLEHTKTRHIHGGLATKRKYASR